MVSNGTNALASSIVLVCRKRPEDAPQTTRRNLIATLRRELRPALKELQASNIAPVDLAQSASVRAWVYLAATAGYLRQMVL